MSEEGTEQQTVEGFPLQIIDSLIFGDEVVEFLIGILDPPDLVFFVDKIAEGFYQQILASKPKSVKITLRLLDRQEILDLWAGCCSIGETSWM